MSSCRWQPTRIGDMELEHRVVFAPTTRFRADAAHAPLPHVAEYYEQRASTPGSLLITEATFIAARAGGYDHAPGIWSDEQISAWKRVRFSRSQIRCHRPSTRKRVLQLWALGRAADVETLAADGLPLVSASDVPLSGGQAPRPLTVAEIKEYVQLYATAASNAVHKAGFDGVEIHAANGYLLDQFLHDRSNDRTDAYDGSVENRTRFPLEVAAAVVKAVGQQKTAMRLSPWGTFNAQADVREPQRYPDFAYLHVVEPRADGLETVDVIKDGYSNDFIHDIWGDRRLISAGGYTRETAIAAAEQKGDLIAFARPYISNPDLPDRLLHGIALAVGNRALYYAPGSVDPKGYTDYPFASAVEAH
ncbi:hypothetical protein C8R43DRAFT_953861 [Mycena crocata]|nr:hypothetical protein C8R43DRAFT_953861 [Mycena crocata]